MSLLSRLIQFVIVTCSKYRIDESHGLSHSMNILHYADNIYQSELIKHPSLKKQERVIYVSAIIHDMCDKKYMNEEEGIQNIEDFLKETITADEIETTKKIISTMSYSKVMKQGFPRLETAEKQLAYHVVREADLLTAYDFDRCMIYHIHTMQKYQNQNQHQKKPETNTNISIETTFENAVKIFQSRVFRHNDNGLLTTEYSIRESKHLETVAHQRIQSWRNILKRPTMS